MKLIKKGLYLDTTFHQCSILINTAKPECVSQQDGRTGKTMLLYLGCLKAY